MQEKIDFTEEKLQQIEPPEQAMTSRMEPLDKPVTCTEAFLGFAILIFAGLVNLLHLSPLYTTKLVLICCFSAFELFQLLIPPRLSFSRFVFMLFLIESVMN